MRFHLLIAVLSIACSCARGQSAERRAEDLLNDCTKGPSAEGVACLAYLNGFVNGIAAVQSLYTSPAGAQPLASVKIVCLPSDGISGEQARRIVVKYMEDHPEQLHMREMAIVVAALATAFPPCRN